MKISNLKDKIKIIANFKGGKNDLVYDLCQSEGVLYY